MTSSGFTVGRSLAFLFGAALVGVSFFLSAGFAGLLQLGVTTSTLWWNLGLTITFLVAGAVLMAWAVSALTTLRPTDPLTVPPPARTKASRAVLRMSSAFLIIVGSGLSVIGLIMSSALFYHCNSAGACIEYPVSANLLQTAVDLCVSGLAILATSVVPLLMIYLQRRSTVPDASSA